ncbi:LysR family transcriptional regulator [Xanthobacter sp. KR7-225]|uniref:LysR family transcriptional regulator n=1 Tax=Xanthobacter sp. KR7-225 TaxID=3156613 RepID=UPI0032B4A578
MDLRQIQYFLCLYEEGSVTRAARRLNIVQPALSTQLAKLEQELGDKLFDRSPKGIIPTPAGQLLHRLYKPIVRDFAEAYEQMVNRTGIVSGRVAIGVIPSLTASTLDISLARFTSQHADVEVSVVEGYSTTLTEWLRSGAVDVIIVNKMPGLQDLEVEHLLDEDLMLVAPQSGHRPSGPVRFKDAAAMQLVIPPRPQGLRNVIDVAAETAGIKLVPRIEIDALYTIQAFLKRTTGYVSMLPPLAILPSLRDGTLHVQPIFGPRITRQIVCARSPGRPFSLAARKLIDMIAADLREAGIGPQPAAQPHAHLSN